MATGHYRGPQFLSEPYFVPNLPFFRLLVRDESGFLFLAGHLGVEEVFGFLEFRAVLIGFLVFGVLEIGIGLLLGRFSFQGGGEFRQEYIIGAAVKYQMVEIGHQAQFLGRLYYVKPIKRAVGQVVGLHEGVLEREELLFAIYFSIRYFLIRNARNQVHLAVLLFKMAGHYRVGFQDGVEGIHNLLCANPIREGEDTR